MTHGPITCADVHFEDGSIEHMTAGELREALDIERPAPAEPTFLERLATRPYDPIATHTRSRP